MAKFDWAAPGRQAGDVRTAHLRALSGNQPGYSRTKAANVREIERRLRSMEKRLERAGVQTSASAVETADHVGATAKAGFSEGTVQCFSCLGIEHHHSQPVSRGR